MSRKMKAVLLAAATAGALFAPLGANASHPACGGNVIAAGGVYVDEREDGIWTYRESNGHEGLQRGGRHPLLGYTDPCRDPHDALGNPVATPDTLLF